MEKELLRKISLHHREGEQAQILRRIQRQKQEQDEMFREGAMVHSEGGGWLGGVDSWFTVGIIVYHLIWK